MLSIPVTFATIAGTAFLVASYANAGLQPAVPPAAPSLSEVSAGGKGDRLQAPRGTLERTAVSVVEVVGTAHATITLRDRDGAVLYRSHPASSTTIVAKDADIPAIGLKNEPDRPLAARTPALPAPARAREGGNLPAGAQPRKRPIGCESALSPLVRGYAERPPSRCLA